MQKPKHPNYDVTQAYERHVEPLVDQILALCQEHNIPFCFAAFAAREDSRVLCATTGGHPAERDNPTLSFMRFLAHRGLRDNEVVGIGHTASDAAAEVIKAVRGSGVDVESAVIRDLETGQSFNIPVPPGTKGTVH